MMAAGILGAGASIAGAAMQGSGDTTTATAIPPPSIRERQGRRQAESLASLAQGQQLGLQSMGSYLTGELLRNVGLNPIMQDNTAYFNASRQAVLDAQNQLSDMEYRISELNAKARLKGRKGGTKQEKKANRQELKQLQNDRKMMMNQIPALQQEAQNWAQNMFQITGYEQAQGQNLDPSTPEGQANLVEKQLGEAVSGALSGDYQNPMLEQSIDKERRLFEERMRRSLGPDWAASTTGMRAMQEFGDTASARRFEAGQQQVRDFIPLWGQSQLTQGQLRESRAGLMQGAMDPGFRLSADARASSGTWDQLNRTRQADRLGATTTTESTDTGGPIPGMLGAMGSSLGGMAATGLTAANRAPSNPNAKGFWEKTKNFLR